MKISLAHSPDSDDAFMFYAIEKNKINTAPYEFENVLSDIQTLNDKAMNGQEYDLSAISYHAFAYVSDNYELLSSGASMGDNYGPTLISYSHENNEQLLKQIKSGEVKVAVPGLLTSAYLALRLYAPSVVAEAVPFDEIQAAVQRGDYQAGLIIHEGQLTYENEGFTKLVNLGEWWFERTGGLPLPLGTNIIRRNLPENVKQDLSRILRESIEYSLNHREEALDFALKFGRGLKVNEADRFVGMYVNDLTLDLGTRGKRSVEQFLKESYLLGFIPKQPKVEFV
jgi:1,4-dihydroxy-6-naphthoate synthase